MNNVKSVPKSYALHAWIALPTHFIRFKSKRFKRGAGSGYNPRIAFYNGQLLTSGWGLDGTEFKFEIAGGGLRICLLLSFQKGVSFSYWLKKKEEKTNRKLNLKIKFAIFFVTKIMNTPA